MKKVMLMLAVALLASPALAGVTISVVDQDGDGPGLTADVIYAVTGEPNNVAAIALDISVDGGATIDAVGDFHVGVSTAAAPGYGIFPANFDRHITVNGAGDVDDWSPAGYTPVADAADKGAAGALGTAAITVELGALYKGDGNAPADTGVLCTITASAPCMVTLAENAIRGGIVLEGAGAPTSVALPGGEIKAAGEVDCLPSDHPDYATWVAMGKPECWCYQTQCHGDADGEQEGSFITGFFRVHFNDLDLLINAWNVKEPTKGPGLAGQPGICADFDHQQEGSFITGFFRVHFLDLDLLINNWSVKEPTKGPGIPKDCGGLIDPDNKP